LSDARQPRRRRVVIVSSVALSLLLGALVFAFAPGALADPPEPAFATVHFQSCYLDGDYCLGVPEASLQLDNVDIGSSAAGALPVGSQHTLVAPFYVTTTRWQLEGDNRVERRVELKFCRYLERSSLSVVHFTVPDGGDYFLAQYVPTDQGCPG
jgi:hypothetical protein